MRLRHVPQAPKQFAFPLEVKRIPGGGTAGAFISPSVSTRRLRSFTLHENKSEVGAATFGSLPRRW